MWLELFKLNPRVMPNYLKTQHIPQDYAGTTGPTTIPTPCVLKLANTTLCNSLVTALRIIAKQQSGLTIYQACLVHHGYHIVYEATAGPIPAPVVAAPTAGGRIEARVMVP